MTLPLYSKFMPEFITALVSDDAALSLDARYEAATEYMDRGVLGFYAGFSVFF